MSRGKRKLFLATPAVSRPSWDTSSGP